MASKSEKRITLSIKGRDWAFILMTDKSFDKLYNANENAEDNNNAAMTLTGNAYEVHFRKSDWDIVKIRHEIGHVLYRMSLVNDASHTPDQVEETFCQIIGHHGPEIELWTDRVAERFFED